TIEFCPQSVDSGWVGISFYSASSQTRLEYVKLETYGDVGIRCYDMEYIMISNCEVNNCGHEVLEIGGGIHCYRTNTAISNCYIHECGWSKAGNSWTAPSGAGIIISDTSNATVVENLISENYGGGIRILRSNVYISNNTISENEARFMIYWINYDYGAEREGGGIYSLESTAVVSQNSIIDNRAFVQVSIDQQNSAWADSRGGGIFVKGGSILLTDNVISGNNTVASASSNSPYSYAAGGGLYCTQTTGSRIVHNQFYDNYSRAYSWGSSAETYAFAGAIYTATNIQTEISNNLIVDNSLESNGIIGVDVLGAGIFVVLSSDSIAYNTVIGHEGGAGITMKGSSCQLYRNLIARNYGGGIQDIDGNFVSILNNTIADNEEFGVMGDVNIKNSIIWNNDIVDSSPSITYSDLSMSYPGDGNILTDPIFMNPQGDDYHLRSYSPCIDAGDPDSPPDPDGTIADMGTFHTPRLPSINIEINPGTLPLIVYPGQSFGLTGSILNECDTSFVMDLSMGVIWELEYYQLQYLNDLLLDPNELITGHFTVHVPQYAPHGQYEYLARAADFGNGIIYDQTEFLFSVDRFPQEEWHDKWAIEGEWVSWDDERTPHGERSTIKAYPNPFNTSIGIKFELQTECRVSLDIYNILGQRVVTLLDKVSAAGKHEINWNASSYPSGVYFYKLTTDDEILTGRITLLK
ncbi:MAG: T9SS type A sorting domain-containing protein, partial [candidate division Zixibacteria bacterium]|nr:T9SS type A sorting domain-containing protein [candidate division Zixibacteria bacterium]